MPSFCKNISGKIRHNLISHFWLITFSAFYQWIIPVCCSTMLKYDILAISMPNLAELGPISNRLRQMFPVCLIMSWVLIHSFPVVYFFKIKFMFRTKNFKTLNILLSSQISNSFPKINYSQLKFLVKNWECVIFSPINIIRC